MYSLIKLLAICLVVLRANVVLAENTLYLQEKALIDSSATGFSLGIRPMIVDDNDTVHLFYLARNNDADFVYQTFSNDLGNSWSAPEVVSLHQHPDRQRYYAFGPTAAIDTAGNIHLAYEYRGYPLYLSSWPDYPPSHINYVTNETGEWVTYQDAVNDSTIQTSEGNGSTVSYLYDPFILSKGSVEYFIASDSAWWAKKYHVVFSERNTGGSWAEGSALVTYNRGATDKYTIKCASLLSDGANIYALWFNRHTGNLNVKTYNGSVDSTIFTADSPGDGSLPNYYALSSISGNGICQAVMSRNENNTLNELFFIKKDAGGWSVDTISVQDTLYSVTSCVLEDTAYIFYRTPGWRSKLIKHTSTGFSTPEVLLTQDGKQAILNLTIIKNRIQPIVWVSPNPDTTMWYLYSGIFSTGELEVLERERPSTYTLEQNYPNPFNPATEIAFSLLENSHVTLTVFNALGQKLATLVDEKRGAGSYQVRWDGTGFSSGIYFYRLETEGFSKTMEMLLMK